MRTRRWVAGTCVLALVLVACDDDGDDEETAAADGEEVADEDADEAADEAADEDADEDADEEGCAVDEVDGDLNFYNWSDYMDPDLIDAFEEEYDVTVTEDFYPSNEELFARVESGGAQYDVIVPSDYMVDIMIQEQLLLPIDFDAVPNAENVDAEFSAPPYDPDLEFSVPYQWGTTGIGVNTEAVGEDVEASWDLLFEPDVAGEIDGRISILDDPRESMGAALYWLGHDPNTTDEEELQEAADVIAEAREWTAAFESVQYADLLIGGETVVGHGYSGTFLDSFGEDENYEYLIPEEGATIWTDNMAILAEAESPCTAHTFVNFMLDAENGAQLTNWTYYASPNEAATEFIVDDVLEDDAIYPDEETRDNLYFLEDTGDAEILFTDYFTQAKS